MKKEIIADYYNNLKKFSAPIKKDCYFYEVKKRIFKHELIDTIANLIMIFLVIFVNYIFLSNLTGFNNYDLNLEVLHFIFKFIVIPGFFLGLISEKVDLNKSKNQEVL